MLPELLSWKVPCDTLLHPFFYCRQTIRNEGLLGWLRKYAESTLTFSFEKKRKIAFTTISLHHWINIKMHQCSESWDQASDYPTTPVLDKDESCWLVHGTHGGVNLNGENSGIFKVFHRLLTGFWWVKPVKPLDFPSDERVIFLWYPCHVYVCAFSIHVFLVFYPANTMQIYNSIHLSPFCRFDLFHLLVSTTALFSRWKLQFTGAPSDGFSHWSTDAGCETLRPHAGGGVGREVFDSAFFGGRDFRSEKKYSPFLEHTNK